MACSSVSKIIPSNNSINIDFLFLQLVFWCHVTSRGHRYLDGRERGWSIFGSRQCYHSGRLCPVCKVWQNIIFCKSCKISHNCFVTFLWTCCSGVWWWKFSLFLFFLVVWNMKYIFLKCCIDGFKKCILFRQNNIYVILRRNSYLVEYMFWKTCLFFPWKQKLG